MTVKHDIFLGAFSHLSAIIT